MRSEAGSQFANEISLILDSYLSKISNSIGHNSGSLDPYDVRFYNTLIPHSCLAKELIKKFVDTPQLAFDENGEPKPDWDNVPDSIKKAREISCTFNNNKNPTKTDNSDK